MKAIILAAGIGSRMGMLSDYIPKPIFPLGDKRLIDYAIETAIELKLEPIIIGGYLSNKLKIYLNKKYDGLKFKNSKSGIGVLNTLLESKSMIKEKNFCWLCSDTIFTDIKKLKELKNKHLKDNSFLSMLISQNHSYTPSINIQDGKIKEFKLLKGKGKEVSSPLFFFSSKKIFDLIESPKIKNPMQEAINLGKGISYVRYEGAFGANNPEEYFKLHKKFFKREKGDYIYDSKVNGTKVYNSIIFRSNISSKDIIRNKIIFGDKYEYKLKCRD